MYNKSPLTRRSRLQASIQSLDQRWDDFSAGAEKLAAVRDVVLFVQRRQRLVEQSSEPHPSVQRYRVLVLQAED